ncbi:MULTISPECIES: ATP-dependent 6-phosphofructokinase [unclassified Leptolyngbya]|uniref:ATP-dependent 6-phosphofructokinase n=1 Tax=unclassified Leptolyngbya TaxID=2650499 RepID=UPI0016892145|nr:MULTISPECIES: ATP-dependent 6-phosphofructokinase [unclassified Leptolyngbya]MBD1911450.1 ATP-dependent 6-phosphofructokinase [Leptolyngbya sp. FACHB-8]MBD2153462.1 ATP-dependent 6-phosphofructokinase [Leptolyngbya sp. FACHB-16]
MSKQKRIGIMTSGGDCPGLNGVIRAVVHHATLQYGWEVVGIPYATQGLLERKTIPLTLYETALRGMDPLLTMGGTILGTINRGNTLAEAQEIIASYHDLALDALIAIGGDGSLGILRQLAHQGNWNMVAIPKTIDNDVGVTERSIGFDTAINTVIDAISRLTFTAASHDRVMVVEVMGREAGHLALNAGIAGGADVILLPEIPYSIQEVCNHLDNMRDRWGRKFAIVVVAEGIQAVPGAPICTTEDDKPSCGMGQYIADQIALLRSVPVETRVTVLGHVQRGGMPSALDRLVAAAFGTTAVDLVAQGRFDHMVTWQGAQVKVHPLEYVLSQSPRLVDPTGFLVQTARGLGIYVGNPALGTTHPEIVGEGAIAPALAT